MSVSAVVQAQFQQDAYIPLMAQTIFTLTKSRIPGGLAVVLINGIDYEEVLNFTMVGNQLTWLDVPFQLDPADIVVAKYQVS